MSVINNKYQMTAIELKEPFLVIEITEKHNRTSQKVDIPIQLFSPKGDEKFLLVVDRIEDSQLIIEISEKHNPNAPSHVVEFPADLLQVVPEEGMKYSNKIEETQDLSNLETINQNLHRLFSLSFSMSSKDEDNNLIREAEERLERLKKSSPTDQIIDL